MLRKSIQLALRKLKQQLLLSLLKIGGLAISIGAAMLLLLYINFQWQYDQFVIASIAYRPTNIRMGH